MKHLLLFCIGLSLLSCAGNRPPSSPEKIATSPEKAWWKEAVVYQLYPRSFKDSDGDGVGDLQGIVSQLDYLKSLGIDVVWLNPIYSSPNDDNGYDISDYRNIMAEFGTLQDFDQLLEGLHARDIRLVMDMVVNHSSDEHAWFQQSRRSRDNPYRNYYHWWNAERGTPTPRYSFFDVNNDAWQYDSLTNAYYLHYFSRKQPDLNWENPKVREEVHDIMRFWLDKGVDGLRLDAFQYVAKDTTFPAFPAGYEKQIIRYYGMGPHLHDYIREMNEEVFSQYDIMTVAEGAGSTFEDAMSLVDPERHELDMVYHFEGVDLGNTLAGYTLKDFKRVYTKWDSAFAEKGWLAIFLGNHDVPRMVSKFGNDRPEFRAASSKMLTTFILSMRGTPYYYNGDELGMTNADFNTISQYRDIAARNGYRAVQQNGGDLDLYLRELRALSRDHARTPFQWDTTAHAGFTTGTPWIAVNDNYLTVNVAVEEKDPRSVLNYFRRMIDLRKQYPDVLVYGRYTLLDEDNPQVYTYLREGGGRRMLVALNFSETTARTAVAVETEGATLLLSNEATTSPQLTTNGPLTLQPYEAVIYQLP
ncbi:oligo-1,6-glucosidase [Catalinimonas alkaloidigena]|uniref:Oligo-1,6-glucosidase n=1 Tax=Catalinimonas alkaloidigena TaxID=1075417 RepID=A0A1G8WZA4_9BACT|nr:alpha-glucosidase [Catalinimonas alkaloidigena]SDJ83692.1 oligo-1,6-glucosidase [Catalinimonas alkaloidigena]